MTLSHTPREKGVLAYERGQAIADNPYQEWCDAWVRWNQGWLSCAGTLERGYLGYRGVFPAVTDEL